MMDFIYKLEELKDEEFKTIEHVKNVIKEQIKLVELIKTADKNEEFKEAVNSLYETVEAYKNQIDRLEQKANLINKVVELSNSNEEIKEAINILIEAFDIFK